MGKIVPKIKPKFVLDENGDHSAVLIGIREYEKLLEYLEDVEDTLAYLKRRHEKSIPYNEVRAKLKKARRL